MNDQKICSLNLFTIVIEKRKNEQYHIVYVRVYLGLMLECIKVILKRFLQF